MVALPFLVLVIALLLGIPIAFCLAGAGVLGLWLVTGDWNVIVGTLAMMPFGTGSSYALTTIPMFILMAYLSSSGARPRSLYSCFESVFAHTRRPCNRTVLPVESLGQCQERASAAAVMSKVAMPEMRRFGYSSLAAGSIGIGSTLIFSSPALGW
jgi:TRAP-type mannitol/chloroaromatic compound transport system permease large subunit